MRQGRARLVIVAMRNVVMVREQNTKNVMRLSHHKETLFSEKTEHNRHNLTI
jgi:hypothetical protein